jgi:hypothetical protein
MAKEFPSPNEGLQNILKTARSHGTKPRSKARGYNA